MKSRKFLSTLLYVVVLTLLFVWITGAFTTAGNTIPYSKVLELFRQEQVKQFIVNGDVLSMELYNPYDGETTVYTEIADPEAFRAELQPLFDEQVASGVLAGYDFVAEAEPSAFAQFLNRFLPMLLAGLIVLFFWAYLMGKANGSNPLQNFGKARTVLGIPDDQKVTFDDVAGADEEKAEMQEVVDFLRNPQKFTDIGARIPHGMLLVGPPGTGKTLLARAVAGEADVQFQIGRAHV